MRYRLLAVLVVISMIIAACGSGDEDTTTTAAAGGGDDGGGTAEVIDIDFWVAFSDEARLGFSEDKAAAFNAKHPEYNVEVTSFASYNDAFDAAVLAVDSGEPPEIIHFFEAATRQALDAVDASGNPIFKSVTEAIGGRGRNPVRSRVC